MYRRISVLFAEVYQRAPDEASASDLLKRPAYLGLKEYYYRDKADGYEARKQPVEQIEIKQFRQQECSDNQKDAPEQLLSSGIPYELEQLVQEKRYDNDIDDIRYLRILDHAAGLGLIILMHAGWDIAYPQQVRCSPEMTARALRQVGPAKIVLAHMGGWKNWDQVEEHLLDTGCYLDTAISMGEIVPLEPGHYTQQELPLLSQEAFCSLVRSFGADRILFGTDSPWACQKTEVNRIMRLPLTGEEKEKILYKNAKRLLSI